MMCAESAYVIGTGKPPEWCRRQLTPFKRMDGSVGYEFNGAMETFIMEAGEKLVKEGNYILIPNIREKRELSR